MSDKVIPTAQVLQLPLQAANPAGPANPAGRVDSAARPYRPPSDVHPVLRRAGAPPAALDLLAQAYRGLDEARSMEGPLERYAVAHLAALRASAAVLAVRGVPEEGPRKRGRIRSAWEVLPEVAPELAEWAVYYAAGAPKRAAAEAGIASAATMRDADDLIRNTALFVRMVQRLVALNPVRSAEASEGSADQRAV
ncbi:MULTISPECIES: SAV_6107 family HEPN domain-containing protein [Streptacidiphilus]|uniref:SAV_6107 family HEPN domain-containing protein n=1 Tax=Streptacidiphilus cavernicola TaxID=3342716 RepID=A0ABV6UXS0_9ACTN|nr:SAV_6107 family HEPN domain-containing protein [Streptacidiphilus jeojiense]